MVDGDSSERLKTALEDRDTIERESGAGGMATLYVANGFKNDRIVVIRVMRPDHQRSPRAPSWTNRGRIHSHRDRPLRLALARCSRHGYGLDERAEGKSAHGTVMPRLREESDAAHLNPRSSAELWLAGREARVGGCSDARCSIRARTQARAADPPAKRTLSSHASFETVGTPVRRAVGCLASTAANGTLWSRTRLLHQAGFATHRGPDRRLRPAGSCLPQSAQRSRRQPGPRTASWARRVWMHRHRGRPLQLTLARCSRHSHGLDERAEGQLAHVTVVPGCRKESDAASWHTSIIDRLWSLGWQDVRSASAPPSAPTVASDRAVNWGSKWPSTGRRLGIK